MATINQLAKKGFRKNKKLYSSVKALQRCPQKRGICIKIFNIKPKKPNSAQRKIAKIKLFKGPKIRASIPGIGHNLQEFSLVMVRGCRVRDVPGMHYKIIRGKYDFFYLEKFERKHRRSKFSIPNARRRMIRQSKVNAS